MSSSCSSLKQPHVLCSRLHLLLSTQGFCIWNDLLVSYIKHFSLLWIDLLSLSVCLSSIYKWNHPLFGMTEFLLHYILFKVLSCACISKSGPCSQWKSTVMGLQHIERKQSPADFSSGMYPMVCSNHLELEHRIPRLTRWVILFV